jgi:hypothetical protein
MLLSCVDEIMLCMGMSLCKCPGYGAKFEYGRPASEPNGQPKIASDIRIR